MSSIEARLQSALILLRQEAGTLAVLKKERESAATLIADAQDLFNDLIQRLVGEDKKSVLLMEKRCADWQIRQDRINL